jgi:hypothetical protein
VPYARLGHRSGLVLWVNGGLERVLAQSTVRFFQPASLEWIIPSMESRVGERCTAVLARVALLIPILMLVSVELSYGETRGQVNGSGAVKYGCEDWRNCTSRKWSPPYDPDQPEKCDQHKDWIKTQIPAGED